MIAFSCYSQRRVGKIAEPIAELQRVGAGNGAVEVHLFLHAEVGGVQA